MLSTSLQPRVRFQRVMGLVFGLHSPGHGRHRHFAGNSFETRARLLTTRSDHHGDHRRSSSGAMSVWNGLAETAPHRLELGPG